MMQGYYIFGYHDFQVRDLRIANVFHRTLIGDSDDFILGVMSVLLIAVVSELFQAIVLRSRQGNRISRNAMYTALLLDELTHFRNLTNLFRLSVPPTTTASTTTANATTNSDHPSTSTTTSRIPIWTSVTVFVITIVLLAAEVFAIYLTQPLNVYTRAKQYNLKGIMPVGAKFNVSKQIMRNTASKKCITPSMMHSNQTRMYTISACIERSDSSGRQNKDRQSQVPLFGPSITSDLGDSDEMLGPSATATSFTVTSWYHDAGCDHQVKFSNEFSSAWHEIKMRATILQGHIGVRKAVRFQSRDAEDGRYARYIHAFFMERAIEGFCAQVSNDSCGPSYFAATQMTHLEQRARNITLWVISDEGSNNDIVETVLGTVTKFDVPPIVYPFAAVEYALPVFATSLAIEEVEGSGLYTDLVTGEYEEEIANLAYEEGRVASATLILVIFMALLLLLLVLRALLKPVSLADIAHNFLCTGNTFRVIVVDPNGNQTDVNMLQNGSNLGTASFKRRVDMRSADDSSLVKISLDPASSSSYSKPSP